jgi:hypothetical protein
MRRGNHARTIFSSPSVRCFWPEDATGPLLATIGRGPDNDAMSRRFQFSLKTLLAVTAILSLPCAIICYGDDVGVPLLLGAMLGACVGFVIGKPTAGTALGLVLAFPVFLLLGVAAVGIGFLLGLGID